MFRAILLQVGVTLVAAVAAGLIVGENGAVSAGLGGGACALPNFLFAWRLTSLAARRGASYPVNFFLGEFIKVAATIAILVLVAKEYADLHWPSLLIGLGLASQAGFLAFWKKS
jgi:ATP synthase protein I